MPKAINNATFGLTVQKLICEEYNLTPSQWAEKQFSSNYHNAFDGVKEIFSQIFEELGSTPEECVTYSKEKETNNLSPHNFYLKNKMTLSIKTTMKKSGLVAPPIVGQAGYEKLNYHFGHLVSTEIKNQDDIRDLIWNNIADMLPTYLDYLFQSDILVWIYIEKNVYKYKIIYRGEKPDLTWEKSNITFTKKDIKDWKESVTVKYKDVSIAEVQVHKHRNYKFRFKMNKLQDLLTKREQTTETLGISIEGATCEIYHLEKPAHFERRVDPKIMTEVRPTILEVFSKIPEPIRYIGNEKGKRGGTSKSSIDFMLQGEKTLSLKTNIGSRVCPPEIGQPSLKTFKLYFSHLIENPDTFSREDFKKIVLEHTAELMKTYLKFLLDCDYLLWIYKKKQNYEYKTLEGGQSYNFEQKNFTFTKNLSTWNESNTVKYYGVTIGEFQVHKNRGSLKFRFHMKNLLDLLEK